MSLHNSNKSQLHRLEAPKFVGYNGDGGGRDSYIIVQNGGFSKGIKTGMQTNKYNPKDRSYAYRKSPSPSKEAKTFTYISDGTGRDSYIVKNSGGLVNDYGSKNRSDQVFMGGLRHQPMSPVRHLVKKNQEPDLTDFLNWKTPKVKALQNLQATDQNKLTQRLSPRNYRKPEFELKATSATSSIRARNISALKSDTQGGQTSNNSKFFDPNNASLTRFVSVQRRSVVNQKNQIPPKRMNSFQKTYMNTLKPPRKSVPLILNQQSNYDPVRATVEEAQKLDFDLAIEPQTVTANNYLTKQESYLLKQANSKNPSRNAQMDSIRMKNSTELHKTYDSKTNRTSALKDAAKGYLNPDPFEAVNFKAVNIHDQLVKQKNQAEIQYKNFSTYTMK